MHLRIYSSYSSSRYLESITDDLSDDLFDRHVNCPAWPYALHAGLRL